MKHFVFLAMGQPVGREGVRYNTLSKGYTLIEILIVLFIISIVASIALLTVGRSDTKRMVLFAKELSEVLVAAQERAMLESSTISVSFGGQTVHVSRLPPEADDKKAITAGDVFKTYAVPSDVYIESNVRDIRISPTGDMTPFLIQVGRRGGKPEYTIRGERDGAVSYRADIH